ncbi:hypothetical protein AVEN_125134-1 [Araneus ventricosus]|uniref:Uncharacterized protein n=1 Tax=Araneus ventricosus TaxID=182803 RepID=A0A4Y2RTU4_ARAVE|nr:hypothetical protein AVEN_125134-1 [Araneus ventricosus]
MLDSWTCKEKIRGNECVDKATKTDNTARETFAPLTTPYRPLSYLHIEYGEVSGTDGQTLENPAFNEKVLDTSLLEDTASLSKLRVGQVFLTHRHILRSDATSICNKCNCILSVRHILCLCKNLYTKDELTSVHIVDLIDILGRTNPSVNVCFFFKGSSTYLNLGSKVTMLSKFLFDLKTMSAGIVWPNCPLCH